MGTVMNTISESEFALIMIKLRDAYRGRFVIVHEDPKEVKDSVFETWYQFFNEYDNETVASVATKWIKHNRIPPTISDLLNGCKEKRKTDRILSPEKIVDMTDEEWMEMMGVTKEDEV